jgi:hypothetical protein
VCDPGTLISATVHPSHSDGVTRRDAGVRPPLLPLDDSRVG